LTHKYLKQTITQELITGDYKMTEENIVFVGKKGTMSYVLAVVTQINNGAGEVYVKARGKAISKAVDVAEIVKNKFMNDVKIHQIGISTEEIATEEGGPLKVSAIEITLKK
jgi:archaea-specific DNA-binding protein